MAVEHHCAAPTRGAVTSASTLVSAAAASTFQAVAAARGSTCTPAALSTESAMSIKLTTQWEFYEYSNYGSSHPDNVHRKLDLTLPEKAVGPTPPAEMDAIDRRNGLWGHALSCEPPYGPMETTVRLKQAVTGKIGQDAERGEAAVRGVSKMKSAMYSGSMRNSSFSERSAELAKLHGPS